MHATMDLFFFFFSLIHVRERRQTKQEERKEEKRNSCTIPHVLCNIPPSSGERTIDSCLCTAMYRFHLEANRRKRDNDH